MAKRLAAHTSPRVDFLGHVGGDDFVLAFRSSDWRDRLGNAVAEIAQALAIATAGADLMLDPTLAHWDVAAIVPVIEAAGGVVTSWTGGDPLAELSLIASAGSLHAEVLSLLHGPR